MSFVFLSDYYILLLLLFFFFCFFFVFFCYVFVFCCFVVVFICLLFISRVSLEDCLPSMHYLLTVLSDFFFSDILIWSEDS